MMAEFIGAGLWVAAGALFATTANGGLMGARALLIYGLICAGAIAILII